MRHVYINQSGTEEISSATLSNIARLAQQDLDETSDLVGNVHVPSALATTKDAVETRFPNLHVSVDTMNVVDETRIDQEEETVNVDVYESCTMNKAWYSGVKYSSDIRIEVKFRFSTTANNVWLFGAGSSSTNCFGFSTGEQAQSSSFVLRYGSTVKTIAPRDTNVHELTITANSVVLDGAETAVAVPSLSLANPLIIIGGNYFDTGFSGDIYYLKVYQGNELKRHFVPSTSRLFDLVSKHYCVTYKNTTYAVNGAPQNVVSVKQNNDYHLMCVLDMRGLSSMFACLTENQAANITSVGTMFQGNSFVSDLTFLKYTNAPFVTVSGYFSNCTNLRRIAFPKDKADGFGYNSFQIFNGATLLEYVDFGNPKSIGDATLNIATDRYMFNNFHNLTKVDGLDDVEKIYMRVFNGCDNLEMNALPPKLKELYDYAFYGCAKLAFTEFPSSLYMIHPCAFQNTSCDFASLPETVTTIEGFPWANLNGGQPNPLYNSTVFSWSGYGNKAIGDVAFNDGKVSCDGNGVVTLLKGQYLGGDAFAYNTKVKRVIGGKINAINNNDCFVGCTNLETIEYDMFETVVPRNLYQNCTSLPRVFNIPEGVTYVASGITNGSSIEELIIPSTVTTLGTQANASNLIKVVINANITTHPHGTFESCKHLRELVLPSTLTDINSFAYNSTRLRWINVNYIQKWNSFYSFVAGVCALKYLEFNNLTNIGNSVLNTPNSIKQIYLNQLNIPAWSANPTIQGNARFYVPDDMVEAYNADAKWATISSRILPASQLDRSEYWGVDFFGDKWYDMKRKPTADSKYRIEAESWTAWANIFGSNLGTDATRYYTSGNNLWYVGNTNCSFTGVSNYNKSVRVFSKSGVTDAEGNSVATMNGTYVPTVNNFLGALNNNTANPTSKFQGTIYKFLWFEGEQLVQAWIGNEEGGFNIFADEDIELQENDVKFPLSAYGA